MARGHGVSAPKSPEQRRRRNAPALGEWVTLEPLAGPVLGVAEKEWSPRVRRLWVAWREDAVSGVWSSADLAAVFELADQFENLAPNEQRLRMDGLGLTPKGRRELRLRYAAEVEPAPVRKTAEVRRLRAVDFPS